MLQDLDAGRETEVDVVNGGVATKAASSAIPTPHNDTLVDLVHRWSAANGGGGGG